MIETSLMVYDYPTPPEPNEDMEEEEESLDDLVDRYYDEWKDSQFEEFK